MSELEKIAFHVAREMQERHAAADATCPNVRHIHQELADRHADEAWSIRENYQPICHYG